MHVNGKPMRTLWLAEDGQSVDIIDQTRLPHRFEIVRLARMEDAAAAIKDMLVRGAPLIGATAAYGVALAMCENQSDTHLETICQTLLATRPTAVNLRWALEDMQKYLKPLAPEARKEAAYQRAAEICDEDVAINRQIGLNGLKIIEDIAKTKPGKPVNILTHCNAGWLATVDWGTATSPIYAAHEKGIPLHVFVDETRPRNQGANLTAWELGQAGVPHRLLVDNAGGHYMQHGEVDVVIVGTDRVTARGDVCNKIGTYLKALAAKDNNIPFYVALPSPTIDWTIQDGVKEIEIEERQETEVTQMTGLTASGQIETVTLCPEGCRAGNPGFDVTPARLVTGLITERGVCAATAEGLASLFPG